MTPFRFAHVSAPDWKACADACVVELGHQGSGLGFVYFTDALSEDADQIVAALRTGTGVEDWVGTVGMGVVATGIEYVDEPALVAMIADFDQGSYRVFSGKAPPPRPGERTPAGGIAAYSAVVHADPSDSDVAGLISDMSTRLESGYLVGGLSSSRGRMVQVANDVVSGGLSGVVLSDEVGLRTRLSQGCAPLPGRYRITDCEGNVIVALDGRPALDVFREAAGELLARDLRRAVNMVLVGIPVQGSDTGDYLVRNLVGIDTRGKLIAIGEPVEQGQEILFCKRDGASAGEDLRRVIRQLTTGAPSEPRGALYFSCIGRGEHTFGRRGDELRLIQDVLGQVPLVGFFCSGEISHDRLYGYTGVLTLFH